MKVASVKLDNTFLRLSFLIIVEFRSISVAFTFLKAGTSSWYGLRIIDRFPTLIIEELGPNIPVKLFA